MRTLQFTSAGVRNGSAVDLALFSFCHNGTVLGDQNGAPFLVHANIILHHIGQYHDSDSGI